MKLPAPFYQLDLRFDADRLRREVDRLPDSAWVSHPNGFAGNAAVILISPGGFINDDFAISGAMQPTEWLRRSPYLQRILAALETPLSRTRLMRVAGGAAVPRHRDLGYHWYRRTRIHIPSTSHPSVRFVCDGIEVHMKPGEAWTFDNFRPHHVENPSAHSRIHLVVDTKGSPAFQAMLERARRPSEPASDPSFAPRNVPFDETAEPRLAFEDAGFEVLTSDEIEMLVDDILNGVVDGEAYSERLKAFSRDWRAVFSRFGHDAAGEMAYAGLICRLERIVRRKQLTGRAEEAYAVMTSMLTTTNRDAPLRPSENGSTRVGLRINASVREGSPTRWSLNDRIRYQRTPDWETIVGEASPFADVLEAFGEPMTVRQASRALADPRFDQPGPRVFCQKLLDLGLIRPVADFDTHAPVFIVSAPRSGSTLLFETLARVPNVWTVGGERHGLIEQLPALHPSAKPYASNRLNAEDATPDVKITLRMRYTGFLEDRDGRAYISLSPRDPVLSVHLLDKIPKNALRIPFLRVVFPNARFLFLYRAPHEAVSSIMEGWRSRRFVTYRDLPGWEDRMPWSFLLPEGWRAYRDASLAEVAAFQWQSTTETIIDDLEALPPNAWQMVTYADFVADPERTVAAICDFADWDCDAVLREYLRRSLPLSRYTLSEPHPEKWRKNEVALRDLLPRTGTLIERLMNLGNLGRTCLS